MYVARMKPVRLGFVPVAEPAAADGIANKRTPQRRKS